MTLHKDPTYNAPEVIEALKRHGLKTDVPNQLSDAFRAGFAAARAAPAQEAEDAARYRWLREQGTLAEDSRHPHSWRCVALLADMGGEHADAAIDAARARQEGGAA